MIVTTRPTLAAAAAPVVIVPALDSGHPGRHVTVRNMSGTNVVELGAPGFAAGAGFELAVNGTVQLPLQLGELLAASAAGAGGAVLHVLVVGA